MSYVFACVLDGERERERPRKCERVCEHMHMCVGMCVCVCGVFEYLMYSRDISPEVLSVMRLQILTGSTLPSWPAALVWESSHRKTNTDTHHHGFSTKYQYTMNMYVTPEKPLGAIRRKNNQ